MAAPGEYDPPPFAELDRETWARRRALMREMAELFVAPPENPQLDVPFVNFTPPDLDDKLETSRQLFVTLQPPTSFTIAGADDWACIISWDDAGWHVEVNQSLSWDANAKHFWNAVASVVGQKVPFGW